MARPIKDTPVLEGEDARRFEAWMAENEGKKITQDEKLRIERAGKKFQVFNSMKEYEEFNASQARS